MKNKRKAIVTGITGQDGSYLAEFLLSQGYEVYGVMRRSSTQPFERIEHLIPRIHLVEADLLDQLSLIRILKTIKPREVYNLASQSFVPTSFTEPVLTGEVTALGVTRMLEAVRLVDPKIRFYQASSSEMYGLAPRSPQTLNTPFYPRSPYGIAKLYGHWMTVNYREGYKLFAVSGILFNHESPRRGIEFVTRKITDAVARIKLGLWDSVTLGNLHAKRDWGFAGDYVKAMWKMLQLKKPEDFIVATGESHSVEDFVKEAFLCAGLSWKKYVEIDPRFYRPAEVHTLCGDAAKARRILKWKPEVNFKGLVRLMVEADIERVSRQLRVS
ncbi:MAG: GDP-mannose 4,6-dehydratase [Candidatus Omnitrophica bacterium]|nr:GDP-mannose 4,6-dehydratase [Candidatus Omnitrophota bacterium]